MKKHLTAVTLLFVVVALSVPLDVDARHNDRQRIDRDELGEDIVEYIPVPVLFGVTLSRLIPDYGDPRGGGTREHEGQDFRAPLGTPIVSPTEAIVIRTGDGPSAGRYIYTANPGGETFRYMHLDEVADLDSGDELEVGAYLGTVGDTGNAPDGVYHLHFEIRDDDNDPTNPFPRLTESFTLQEKMEFLEELFRNIRNDDAYAEFLVETFPTEFETAAREGYELPRAIEEVLDDNGVLDRAELTEQLAQLVATIPALLRDPIREGDQGVEVALLQTFIIFFGEGAAHAALQAAGATGYYGPLTSAAVLEYQASRDLVGTGAFDVATRKEMMQG